MPWYGLCALADTHKQIYLPTFKGSLNGGLTFMRVQEDSNLNSNLELHTLNVAGDRIDLLVMSQANYHCSTPPKKRHESWVLVPALAPLYNREIRQCQRGNPYALSYGTNTIRSHNTSECVTPIINRPFDERKLFFYVVYHSVPFKVEFQRPHFISLQALAR